jgi:pyruvate dehydrogenase E1 component alpha subunit
MSETESQSAVPLLAIWRSAARIRAVDETMRGMINRGEFMGFYYSPRGQEVLAATVGTCLRRDDYLVTTYRGLHDQLAKGVPLTELLAEYLGKQTGSCGGKGGPMHVADPSAGVMVTTGIVGAGLPIGAGLALGAKLAGDDRVCVTTFGDGATNIGAFHEALNLAAVWQLPAVFVCQNNEFGEFTPRTESQRVEIFTRAAAYGMPGRQVDGNDAVDLWPAVSEAVQRARAGQGPTLLDCKTYRFMGHYYGEPMVYMDKAELARRMDADPVDQLRARVLIAGAADNATLAAIEAEIALEIETAVAEAKAAGPPDPSALVAHVYAEVG